MNRRLTGKDPPRAPPEAIVWSVSPAIGPKFRLSVLGFSARFGANARVDQRLGSTELRTRSGERNGLIIGLSPAFPELMYQAPSAPACKVWASLSAVNRSLNLFRGSHRP